MKRLLFLLCCLPLFALAQDKPLIAEGASPDLYIVHTVGLKENYYSIGRIYNISPKEFAPYNNLSLDKGLSPGQKIKIPLTGNFVQSGAPAATEVLVPVYHTVKDKEGLYRISNTFNKLPVATLKKWNNISGEEVSNGTNLIIGYLKVKKDLSPLASQGVTSIGTSGESAIAAVVERETPKPVMPVAAPPKKIKEPVITAPETKVEEAKTDIPQEAKEVKPEIKKEEQVAKEVPMVREVPTVKEKPTTNSKEFNGGFFKNDFNGKDAAKENGTAAVFKSTSGWEDGKYYCLYNTASSGAIVKITNNTTGKSVYAKVLDLIPDIKQNTGLLIRVSNAAADQLGVTDEGQFDCTVEYSK